MPMDILEAQQYKQATLALFWEERSPGIEPIYTLKDEDHSVTTTDPITGEVTRVVYKSLYKLYMQEEDLTEYIFASKYLKSWNHWQRIANSNWFAKYITRWRTELELKLKAEALRSLIEDSRLGGKNSYDAKKYLINKGWLDKTTESNRRGRPSKSEILAEASRQALSTYQVDQDLKRLEELN